MSHTVCDTITAQAVEAWGPYSDEKTIDTPLGEWTIRSEPDSLWSELLCPEFNGEYEWEKDRPARFNGAACRWWVDGGSVWWQPPAGLPTGGPEYRAAAEAARRLIEEGFHELRILDASGCVLACIAGLYPDDHAGDLEWLGELVYEACRAASPAVHPGQLVAFA